MADAVANLLLDELKGAPGTAEGRNPVARQVDNIFQAASATTAGLIAANQRRIALSGALAVRAEGREDSSGD